jgi:hypothetical protein
MSAAPLRQSVAQHGMARGVVRAGTCENWSRVKRGGEGRWRTTSLTHAPPGTVSRAFTSRGPKRGYVPNFLGATQRAAPQPKRSCVDAARASRKRNSRLPRQPCTWALYAARRAAARASPPRQLRGARRVFHLVARPQPGVGRLICAVDAARRADSLPVWRAGRPRRAAAAPQHAPASASDGALSFGARSRVLVHVK